MNFSASYHNFQLLLKIKNYIHFNIHSKMHLLKFAEKEFGFF